jgi:hypothetical protein
MCLPLTKNIRPIYLVGISRGNIWSSVNLNQKEWNKRGRYFTLPRGCEFSSHLFLFALEWRVCRVMAVLYKVSHLHPLRRGQNISLRRCHPRTRDLASRQTPVRSSARNNFGISKCQRTYYCIFAFYCIVFPFYCIMYVLCIVLYYCIALFYIFFSVLG